jgi:hypothetical protein
VWLSCCVRMVQCRGKEDLGGPGLSQYAMVGLSSAYCHLCIISEA